MNQMDTAPKDGSEIDVFAHGQWWTVQYQDCQWMRDGADADNVPDAWAIENADGPGHIELNEAMGWRPSFNHIFDQLGRP